MEERQKKMLQNIVILQKMLVLEDIEEKVQMARILNDNGIYCGGKGLFERLERLEKLEDYDEINRLIRHVMQDIIYLRG